MLRIDGSYGEGGGQILRTSLALSAILGQGVEVYNIRAGRQNPGLMAQHLTCVKALVQICEGQVDGAEIGSQRLLFIPNQVSAGIYSFDVSDIKSSAGSIGLVFQTVAPVLAFAREESKVILKGGTHVPWSPSVDYLKEVFLNSLKVMGLIGELEAEIWGWYPLGGGLTKAKIIPVSYLRSLDLTHRGILKELRILSAVSNLPVSIAERQLNQVRSRIVKAGLTGRFELFQAPSTGKGSFVFIAAEFEDVTVGFSALGERGKSSERVADEAVDQFLHHLISTAAVDSHLADQLVLYMALSRGKSSLTVSKVSQHLLTNISVIQSFLPVKFQLKGNLEQEGYVEVEGVGFSKGIIKNIS